MKKIFVFLLLLALGLPLFGQDAPTGNEGTTLTTGRSAALGVEASTTFAWDLENKSTGLDTKAGIELIFPLFPEADRNLDPGNYENPAVRIALKNASFTWWNTYSTAGGNYAQDDFNSWRARPLVLSFDDFFADLVWTNYFFRIASSTTVMRTTQSTLFSIFDDLMDTEDRWYINPVIVGSSEGPIYHALWHRERYNIQQFPLLKEKIAIDFLDDDYRSAISGVLALGAEFDWFSAAIKAASHKNGLENNDNAWLIGLDAEIVPVDYLLFSLTGFYGINFQKNTATNTAGKNPLSIGASLEYRIPFSDRYILTPKLGFDFAMETISEKSVWELSGGFLFHTRGYDFLASSRVLDWDNVIPVGASLSASLSQDSNLSDDMFLHAMLSFFEPAGRDSMIPYFGGFLQLELANMLEANDSTSAFGVLAQIEYCIAEKFTPYIRGGYIPEFQAGSTTAITGDYLAKGALGCYLTLIHFFSIDVRYEMDMKLNKDGGSDFARSVFSTVFTIRM